MKSRKFYLYFFILLLFAFNSINLWPGEMINAMAQGAGVLVPGSADSNRALHFDGTNDYVVLDNLIPNLPRPELGLSTFTIEASFVRQGAGITATTGTEGVYAVPLVTKGVKEHSDPTKDDMNYFLGIQVPGNVLVADFKEKGTGILGNLPGQSHPLIGKTPLLNNVWYHAAATYDGITWRLYLNGNLEAEACVGQPPANTSHQYAAVGTAMNSLGEPSGFFNGIIDEVRIWNYARSPLEIQSKVNQEVSTYQPGLVGRWGFNENTGTVAAYTGNLTSPIFGTIFGASWTGGSPFNLVVPPNPPLLISPKPGNIVNESANLSVSATDPAARSLTYKFYVRRAPAVPDPDFTIVDIPDSQNYYTAKYSQYFVAQTRWAVQCRSALNIAAVTHTGDVVNDTTGWDLGDSIMSILESPGPNVIPYGISVGNHDDDVTGAYTQTVNYNQHFGISRFSGRSYYGGHYAVNNDNNYILFSASGFKFIIIHLAFNDGWDSSLLRDVLTWANDILKANSDRRAIVVFHNLFEDPTTLSNSGEKVLSYLGSNPNLFLMLSGHIHAECFRKDDMSILGGNKSLYSMCADFQDDIRLGNGYLRILRFSSSEGLIHVRTFSPKNGESKTDPISQFDLPYTLAADKFTLLSTKSGVTSGSQVSVPWTSLQKNIKYEWYVTVSNGVYTTTSQVFSFNTGQLRNFLPLVTRLH